MRNDRQRAFRAVSFSALVALSCLSWPGGLGCSAVRSTGTFDGGGGASAADTTSGAVDPGEGEGGASFLGGSSGGGLGAGGEAACAQATAEAQRIPLTIFVAVDQSGSMTTDGKWDDVKSAFTQFFQDPSAGSISIALRFWPDPYDFSDPHPAFACNDAADFNCGPSVVAACEQPEVDVGLLSDPAHAQELIDAFAAHKPDGSTPTSAALDGATKWAAKYVYQHNHAEQAIVLLVTDGEPTTCNTDPAVINSIAAKAHSGAGVLTFAVGLAGSNQATMDAIAQAGGTGQAFMIGNGAAAQELLGVLEQIRANAVACSYAMPSPPDPGDAIDLQQVDVGATPSGGGARKKFPQVTSAAACPPGGGWYYDKPGQPTTINLCPASCTQVQSDSGARVDIFLGCIKKGPN